MEHQLETALQMVTKPAPNQKFVSENMGPKGGQESEVK